MPSGELIQQYLNGAWRMMMGRSDGIGLFDLSADGFWNSFYAIIVALPVMLATWVPIANQMADGRFGDRLSYVSRLAVLDLAMWVLPLALFALAAGPLGLANRLVTFIVATNWGSALIAWLSLPVTLFDLFWPEGSVTADIATLIYIVGAMVLAWRLTNTALARGPAIASAVFFGMLAASVAVMFLLQPVLGVSFA